MIQTLIENHLKLVLLQKKLLHNDPDIDRKLFKTSVITKNYLIMIQTLIENYLKLV